MIIIKETLICDQFVDDGSYTKTVEDISWKLPPLEWVTLNFDSSVILETGRVVIEGLYQDVDGCCLAVYIT
ncbi:hypothetical protein LINPERPRIM_LOCUS9796 [Linum perenne]